MADGCDGFITCSCTNADDTCGGGGTAGQCGCTPLTKETACVPGSTTDCGEHPNNCGGDVHVPVLSPGKERHDEARRMIHPTVRRLRWPTLLTTGLFLAAACGGGNSTPGLTSVDGGQDGHAPDGHHNAPDTGHLINPDTGTGDSNTSDACASTLNTANVSPLDMFILLDRSGSMAYNDSWTEETQALEDFFFDANSDGIGVALQYMPLTALCDSEAYAVPAVPISQLPMAQGTLITSLGSSRPFGGTPTTVALEGVLKAAEAQQKAQPTHKVVIVLSTDGLPDSSCATVPDGGLPNSTATAVTVIEKAAAEGFPTFVIGVGNEPALNQFAAAGGTNNGKAILVGAGDAGTTVDIEGQLLVAFAAIRDQAIPCEVKIPPSTGGAIDYQDVNVNLSSGADGGTPTPFYGVPTAADCKTQGPTWYYDSATNPKYIELCPEACTVARAAKTGSLSVVFGCTPTIAPPPTLK